MLTRCYLKPFCELKTETLVISSESGALPVLWEDRQYNLKIMLNSFLHGVYILLQLFRESIANRFMNESFNGIKDKCRLQYFFWEMYKLFSVKTLIKTSICQLIRIMQNSFQCMYKRYKYSH